MLVHPVMIPGSGTRSWTVLGGTTTCRSCRLTGSWRISREGAVQGAPAPLDRRRPARPEGVRRGRRSRLAGQGRAAVVLHGTGMPLRCRPEQGPVRPARRRVETGRDTGTAGLAEHAAVQSAGSRPRRVPDRRVPADGPSRGPGGAGRTPRPGYAAAARPPGSSPPAGPPVSPAPALSAGSGWTGCHRSESWRCSTRCSTGTTSAPRRHRPSSSWPP